MPVPLAQFLRNLTESGLIPEVEIQSILQSIEPDRHRPEVAQEFARVLVQRRKLTRFQAEAVYRGATKSLVLEDYVILEKLGQGGMGVVFKAEHRRMGRVVAIKVLPSEFTKDPDALKRFQREVRAAACLTHPNIVAALDAREAKGVHFLVMEFVDGKDLSRIVKQDGALEIPRAINYIVQAACGLAHAHAAGIIHRDIKPANLLVDGKGHLKVLDLGLVRFDATFLGQAPNEREDLTVTGNLMGTVDFMSPEQALDTKHADARSDIYSLGCSLYYLLTGHAAYSGDTMVKKILAHRQEPIPSVARARPDVNASLNSVLHKMIAKQPDDRYQTMGEVVHALTALNLNDSEVTRTVATPLDATVGPRTPPTSAGTPTNFLDSLSVEFGRNRIENLTGQKAMGSVELDRDGQPGRPAALTTKSQIHRRRNVAALVGALGVVSIFIGAFYFHGIRTADTVIEDHPNLRGAAQTSAKQEQDEVDKKSIEPSNNAAGELSMASTVAKPDQDENLTAKKDGPTSDNPTNLSDSDKFLPLFNGHDLTGWRSPGGAPGRWSVDVPNQILRGNEPNRDVRNRFVWLYTDQKFVDFRLRMEFRMGPDTDSGVTFRTDPWENPNDGHIEIQFMGNEGNPVPTGTVIGLRADINHPNTRPHLKAPVRLEPDWNLVEIELRGTLLKVTINDQILQKLLVQDRAGLPTPSRGILHSTGRIGLQSRTGHVEFRKIEIQELNQSGKY